MSYYQKFLSQYMQAYKLDARQSGCSTNGLAFRYMTISITVLQLKQLALNLLVLLSLIAAQFSSVTSLVCKFTILASSYIREPRCRREHRSLPSSDSSDDATLLHRCLSGLTLLKHNRTKRPPQRFEII